MANYFAVGTSRLAPGDHVTPDAASGSRARYVVEEVVQNLEVPWAIAWTAPDRMLVTERSGRIRVVLGGKLLSDPLAVFSDVHSGDEEGLMGIAVDPDYAANRRIYVCYASRKESTLIGRIVRLHDNDTSAIVDKILIDDIPSAPFHAGCALAFGPDKKLYVTTGDATNKALPQDLHSLAGKILRINPDGSVPEDNPFTGSLVWSFGHRNPQGLAWHPKTYELYATEHGPSLYDGPRGGDEVNHIVRGGNYGWPLVSHKERKTGTIAPILLFTPAEAPGSAAFFTATSIPQFTDNLFFGALAGEGLVRMVIDHQYPDHILSYEKLREVRFGRIRAVAPGPDGFLYFSTSNRDLRGTPSSEDDRIFRIRP